MKEYDRFISLGLNCQVSSKIRQFCDTYTAYFYNWVAIRKLDSLLKSLDVGMDLLLSQSQPAVADMFAFREFTMFIHGRLQFESIRHENEERRAERIACAENELIERLGYLMKKLLDDMKRIERGLFIVAVPPYCLPGRKPKSTKTLEARAQLLRKKLLRLSARKTVRDLLVITAKGSVPLFPDSEGLYHRETVLAPGEDALTRDNNADWCGDIFSEFRVVNDAKFELLTHAALSGGEEFDYDSLDLSSLRFSVGHAKSSLLSVFSHLNPQAAQHFAQHVLSSGRVADQQFYIEAARLFAQNRRFVRAVQSLLQAHDRNLLQTARFLPQTLKALK
jgi:hypothetical protein